MADPRHDAIHLTFKVTASGTRIPRLGWKPSQNWVRCAVCLGNVVMPWITSIVQDHIILQGWWHYIMIFRVRQKSRWFQYMYINVLLINGRLSDYYNKLCS